MRILMLNYEFPPLGGGASPVSYEIAKGYVKLGHSVDIVTMGFKGLPHYEQKEGINIYRVKCWRNKKEICHPWEMITYIVSAKTFLRKHLKNNSFDICHTHFLIPTGLINLWLKKKYNIPYIITSHGSDIPKYNTDRFRLLHKFTGPILKKILNNSNGAFAGSQYLANLGNNIGAFVKYKVIREGFDYEKFKPKKKKKIIFSSGRLLKRKGFQYLIEAVSSENVGYEVHIAGDGPMMYDLKELVKKSKTTIIMHGWINNSSEKYKDLLESASIFVLASEKENASVSLLEAMSAGCAVITSNVSGCPETIADAGLTVEPRSAKQIKDAIMKIIGQEDVYGRKARERIMSNYVWSNNVEKYLKELMQYQNL